MQLVSTLAAVLALAAPAAGFGPKPPAPGDTYSLSPRASCGAQAACYQGSEKSLALVTKLDPSVCKDMIMRKGNCTVYAYTAFKGYSKFLAATLYLPAPGPHLWFHLVNYLVPGGLSQPRCGEVDAATRMPPAIFLNKKALALYVEATESLWPGTSVGRCQDTSFTNQPYDPAGNELTFSALQGSSTRVGWQGDSSKFAAVCLKYCKCTYMSPFKNPTPPNCPDEPPNSVGAWCSLCGKKFNAAVAITFYKPTTPPAPPPAPAADICSPKQGCNVCATCCETYIAADQCGACVKQKCVSTLADIAAATPSLSTLVAALKAADLFDTFKGTVGRRGNGVTLFAPTNKAFASLPAGVLKNLLKPKNKAKLADILTFHVVNYNTVYPMKPGGRSCTGPCGSGQSLEGKKLYFAQSGTYYVCSQEYDASKQANPGCQTVSTANVQASNGVVQIIDGVLIPPSNTSALAALFQMH